jgi:hypothetical protein
MEHASGKIPADSSRINVNEERELQYWTSKFGVTAEKLKLVVSAVGNSVWVVTRHLGSV